MFGAAGLSASPVTLHLVSFNGPWPNGWVTGYPYTLTLSGGAPFWAMCDDYNHDGTPDHDGISGDTWLANLTNLGTGDLTNLRFASFGLTAYEEVGWILLQTEVTAPSQWPDMNYAVWQIFIPACRLTSRRRTGFKRRLLRPRTASTGPISAGWRLVLPSTLTPHPLATRNSCGSPRNRAACSCWARERWDWLLLSAE